MGMTALLVAGIATTVASAVTSSVVSSRNTNRTNATNASIAQSTNEANVQMQRETNQLNRELFEEQNEWNLQQWERENEYNSPKNQVVRFAEAGINPLWAISGEPGQAQHLESAQPAAMLSPSMSPYTMRPLDASIINGVGDALASGLRDFFDYSIRSGELGVHESAQKSEAEVNAEEADYLRSKRQGQEIENKWTVETFAVRLDQEAQKLRNLEVQASELRSRSNKNEQETRNLQELEKNIIEDRKLISEKITATKEQVAQNWKQLSINMMNAQTNATSVKVAADELELKNKGLQAQCAKWDNDTLMSYIYKFGRKISGNLKASVDPGIPGFGISGQAGIEETQPSDMQSMLDAGFKMSAAVIEVVDRAQKDPTPENLDRASKAAEQMESASRVIGDKIMNSGVMPGSILNPPGLDTFGSWSSWQ